MNSKRIWRRIFGEFLVGDRVKIINQAWLYKNQIGIISETTIHEGTRFYLVKLPSQILRKLGGSPNKLGDNVGYFRASDLVLVHGNSKPSPLRNEFGQVAFLIPEGTKIGRITNP